MSLETIAKCPVCQNTPLKPLRDVKDHFGTKETFTLNLCDQCETLTTTPRPTESDIVKYYKSNSYVSHGDSGGFAIDLIYKTVQHINFRHKHTILSKYTLDKNHLDYGCGTGSFLSYLQHKRWTVTGIEPDNNARSIAQDTYKLPKVYSSLSGVTETEFSSISLFHVLEHVHSLKETLDHLSTLLSKNGVLILALPNYKSFDAQHYQEYWAGYDVPRHLHHFSQKSIHQLAKSFGLNIVATHPMKFDSYYVSLLSEQYKRGRKHYLNAFRKGYRSNRQALKTHEYSSLIYVLSK